MSNGFVEEESVEQLRLTLSSLKIQINYAEKSVVLAENVWNFTGNWNWRNPSLSDSLDGLVAKELLEENDASDYSNNIDIRLAENNVTSESLLYRLEREGLFVQCLNGMYGEQRHLSSTDPVKMVWLFGLGLRVRVPI